MVQNTVGFRKTDKQIAMENESFRIKTQLSSVNTVRWLWIWARNTSEPNTQTIFTQLTTGKAPVFVKVERYRFPSFRGILWLLWGSRVLIKMEFGAFYNILRQGSAVRSSNCGNRVFSIRQYTVNPDK